MGDAFLHPYIFWITITTHTSEFLATYFERIIRRNWDEVSLLFYSTQTELVHSLSVQYYSGCFYVYCVDGFDVADNPPSSNPRQIYIVLRDIAQQGDRGHPKLLVTKIALKRVARKKWKEGNISEQQFREIQWRISHADTREFSPRIYLIPQDKVVNRIVEVPVEKRASLSSREFIIPDLKLEEFDYICNI